MWAYKPLFLPSCGFFYNSIINIKEPDLFLANRIQNEFIDSSESEFLYFIISRYTSFNDPGEMLYRDAFYIWMYLFSIMNLNDPISLEGTCKSCSEKNIIKIKLEENKLTFINDCFPKTLQYTIDNFTFHYEYRKLKHNIHTGTLEIDTRDNNNFIDNLYSYFFPQCLYIERNDKNEIINKNNLIDIFNSLGYRKLSIFFNEVKKEPWGLEDTYIYKCPNCNSENMSIFGDTFSSSLYSLTSSKINSKIKDLIYVCSYKMLTLTEILSLPISQWEHISKAMLKIQKEKSGVKNFLDEIGGE